MRKIAFLLFCMIVFHSGLAYSQVNNSDTATYSSVSKDYAFDKVRMGGYGEMLFQQKQYGPYRFGGEGKGSPRDSRSEISIPRFIVAFDYKFSPSIILSSEIEFEYGGTGSGLEHEYTEGGEYETEIEKGGEVALEQFHITKIFSNAFAIRAGHMIVPVGLTNSHHEPIHFFGTTRPEGETTLLPSTWHETGLALLGKFRHFNYEAMVVNGLDPNGFDRENWIKNGRQTKFEISGMTNPAFAGRVEYEGIKNTRLGISGYYAPETGKNASNPSRMKGIKGAVTLISADAQYKSRDIIARGNIIYGNLSQSQQISKVNAGLPKSLGFARTPVAKNALTYGVEAGYNVGAFFDHKATVFPFVRYEYHNSMEDTEKSMVADPRYKVDMFTVGVNYYILPNLVAKGDFSHRRIDTGNFNKENTFSLGLAYVAWFFQK